MKNLKKYGNPPYNVLLIHGGPGAAGEMEPVAQELKAFCGICEPYQTEKSIDGQIEELKSILENETELPVILVGYSWGGWLSYIFAAKYPALVKKLILISCGPFEEKYAQNIMKTRLSRLDANEKERVESLLELLKTSSLTNNKDNLLQEFGELLSKAESFLPIPSEAKNIVVRNDIYESIWNEAKELRASGKLLQLGEQIECPVVAIHGDYDPHDSRGVNEPLSSTLKQFRFILLQDCGHCPWIEQNARESFYTILKQELSA